MIVCARLIVPAPDLPPIPDGAIRVEGGRITAIGPASRLFTADPANEVVDYGEHVLIPGMVDSHNHLSLDCRIPSYLERMRDTDAELTLRAVNTLETDLRSGVTTSRCLGDRSFLDIAVRRAVEERRIRGPNLLVATRGMRAGHGHGFVGYPCDGPEPLRRFVRENIVAGADLIKFYVTGTFPRNGTIPCYFTRVEIEVIVSEASRVGLPTAVHCIGGPGLELCLGAGVTTIEHGYFISDREIDLLADSESRLVVTPSEFLTDKPTLGAERAAAFRAAREQVHERLAAVVRSGIFYAAGTDGMHGALAGEAKHLVDTGARPADAFAAVTKNGASVCGLEHEIGTLETGKRADIVVVEGNPLEDIEALSRVHAVIKGGEIVEGERTAPVGSAGP